MRAVGFGWQAWPGVAWMERHGSGGGFGWQAWYGWVRVARGVGCGWQARNGEERLGLVWLAGIAGMARTGLVRLGLAGF